MRHQAQKGFCGIFTSTEFKDECQTRGFCLTLAAPEHQEMNLQVQVTSMVTVRN